MARPKGRAGVQWRHQSVPEEWALQHELRTLAIKVKVAAAVSARQGHRCCFPDCEHPIISYPHGIRWDQGGVDDEINRAGVCASHQLLMRGSRESDDEARAYLQGWLQRYYQETAGLAPEVWELIARGRPPADLEVTGT
ncbi:MAG TPA: hypothetical protein VD969_19685 [Symbiobacteriaceae bacterium]|nr:hypothetical protein [Symbiobacteriaceae bacterium]